MVRSYFILLIKNTFHYNINLTNLNLIFYLKILILLVGKFIYFLLNITQFNSTNPIFI